MRRGGLLIIVGLLLLVVVGGVLLLPQLTGLGRPVATTPPVPTVQLEFEALIALDSIPRGRLISEEMLSSKKLPMSELAAGVLEFNQRDRVIGKTAAQDIKANSPMKEDYAVDLEGYLRGSLASLYIPQGSVAVAFPADRLTSVAYALQPGDRIDVIATFLVVDVDPQFQTILPNYAILLSPDGLSVLRDLPIGVEGQLPGGNQTVSVVPNSTDKSQRPRAVTQLTLQNVLVLNLGEWSTLYAPTPVPVEPQPATEAQNAPEGQQAQPTATPVPRPDIVTLALPRQDALALMYFLHTGASIEFALRPAGDTATDYAPEPVTLYYVFTTFRIPEPPPALPYATEPGLWPLTAIPDSSSDPLFLTPLPHPNPTWASGL
jgi:Flp pilus assembly protein CpaB